MPILENIAAIAKGMSITFMEIFQPSQVENYPDGPGPLRGAKFQGAISAQGTCCSAMRMDWKNVWLVSCAPLPVLRIAFISRRRRTPRNTG